MHVTLIQVADSLCSGDWFNYALLQGDVQQSNLVETSFLMLNTFQMGILCMQTYKPPGKASPQGRLPGI